MSKIVSEIERIAIRGDDFAIPPLLERINLRNQHITISGDHGNYHIISVDDTDSDRIVPDWKTEDKHIISVLIQIASRGNGTVTRLLLARLGTSSKWDMDLHLMLIKGLAQVASRGDQDVIRALLKVLIDNTPSAPHDFLARNCPTCFECIRTWLENTWRVRLTVLKTLTEIAEPGGEIAPILLEALVDRLNKNNDGDPWVREAAVGALGKVANQDFFVATLRSRLSREGETDCGVKKVVLRTLQGLQAAQVAPIRNNSGA